MLKILPTIKYWLNSDFNSIKVPSSKRSKYLGGGLLNKPEQAIEIYVQNFSTETILRELHIIKIWSSKNDLNNGKTIRV